MLSYAVPTKDTQIPHNNRSSAMTPHRNLSLNLSPQFPHKNNGSELAAYEPHKTNVSDCDERTSLLTRISTPPPTTTTTTTRQNSNNFINNNNNNNSSIDQFDDTDTYLGNSITMDSDTNMSQAITTTTTTSTKKTKLSKLGTKSVGLKRVSFGSSKGSMVETLVFETPTPLSEKVEPSFGNDSSNRQNHQKSHTSQNLIIGGKAVNLDDSGIDAQEESERSIVRVSIYQSSKPQQICHPDYLTRFDDNLEDSFNSYNCNFDDSMTTTAISSYDRQQSTDSGWENPFRPGGDLSREADEIVNMIKGGKPITPTEDHVLGNGNAQKNDHSNGNAVTETVNKTNLTQTQSAQNGNNAATKHTSGTAGKTTDNNGVTTAATTQVSNQVVPGPASASHVVIDEKKNKKKGCCVLQ